MSQRRYLDDLFPLGAIVFGNCYAAVIVIGARPNHYLPGSRERGRIDSAHVCLVTIPREQIYQYYECHGHGNDMSR